MSDSPSTTSLVAEHVPGLVAKIRDYTHVNLTNCKVNFMPKDEEKHAESTCQTPFGNIQKSTELVLKDLEADKSKFVETRAFRSARQRLKDFGVVVITGRAGDGKTTIGKRCLQHMALTRTPVIMTEPNHWDIMPRPASWDNVSAREKFVVLIDDFFGRDGICSDMNHGWMSRLEQMWLHVLYGHVSLVIISRTDDFRMKQEHLSGFKIFQSVHHVSLSSHKHQLNDKEKLALVECYAKKKIDPVSVVATMPDVAVPQVCSFFAESKAIQKRGLNYFSNPIECIMKELKRVKEQQYFILVLVAILGKLPTKIFYNHNRFDKGGSQHVLEKVKQVRKLIPFSFDVGTTNLETVVNSMVGVYLSFSRKDHTYRFIHPVIEDSIILSLSDVSLESILDICPVRVLNMYMITPPLKSSECALTKQVSKQEMIFLAQRISYELCKGDYKGIMSHPALSNKEFVCLLTGSVLKADGCEEIAQRKIGLVHVQEVGRFFLASDNTIFEAPSIIPKFHGRNRYDIDKQFYARLTERWICNFNTVLCFLLMNNMTELAFSICQQIPDLSDVRLLRCACYIGDAKLVRLLFSNTHLCPWDLRIREMFTCCVVSQKECAPILSTFLRWMSKWTPIHGSSMKCLLDEALRLALLMERPKYLKILLRELRKQQGASGTLIDLLFQFVLQCRFHGVDSVHDVDNANFKEDLKTKGIILNMLVKEGADGHRGKLIFLASQCESSYILEQFLVHLEWRELEYRTGDEIVVKRREVHFAGRDVQPYVRGRTPLLEASKRCLESMLLLLNHGADVNAVDEEGYTIFHCSWLYQNDEMLKRVMTNAETCFSCLSKSLNMAARYGSVACLEMFLHKARSELHQIPQTVLTEALVSNVDYVSKLMLLLKAGLCVNSNNILHDVLRYDSDHLNEIMDVLLEVGVDLDLDAKMDRKDLPLHNVMRKGQFDVARKLIELGADVNAQAWYDDSLPLHIAIRKGNIDMAEELIASGASIHKEDNSGCAALSVALAHYKSSSDIICTLLAKGANTLKTDKRGATPISLAAKNNYLALDVFKQILHQKKVNRLYVSYLKINPIGCASNFEKLELLVDAGFCFSRSCAQDGLHTYVKQNSQFYTFEKQSTQSDANHDKFIRLFCEKGACINKLNDDGKTPLQVAFRKNNRSLMETLIKHGADPNVKDIKGNMVPAEHRYISFANSDGFLDVDYCRLKMMKEAGAKFPESRNWSELVKHCSGHGMWQCLDILLESGISPDVMFWSTGRTLLHNVTGSWRSLVVLLKYNPKCMNVRDLHGNTALHLVTRKAWTRDKVSLMIKHGADPNIRDKNGRTPFLKSVLFRLIIWHPSTRSTKKRHKIKKIHGREDYMYTPKVTRQNNEDKRKFSRHPWGYEQNIDTLLKHGADGDIKVSRCGGTCLHIAVKECDFGLIRTLVNGGCSVNLTNDDGDTPLHMTIKRPMRRKTKIIEVLVSGRCDVNVEDSSGNTALHLACKQGLAYVVYHLLEQGAQHDVVNEEGDTPLHIAVGRGWWKIVETLLKKEAGTDPVNKIGQTPLFLAASRGFSRVSQCLLDSGADADAADDSDLAPIHMAAMGGYWEVVKVLLDGGCDIDAKDVNGDTALHIAARNGQVKVVKLLLENRCDANEENDEGNTALHISVWGVRYRIVKILLKHWAELKDNRAGETPLDLCRRLLKCRWTYGHHLDMILYLLDKRAGED